MNAEPSGAGVSGSIVWIGSHVPSVTSPTNRRTFGATERNAASTPRPGRRRRRELHDRPQQQAADQSAVVNGEVDAQLGVAADGDDRDERARLVHVDRDQLRVGGRLECLIDRGRVHLREKRAVEMGAHVGVGDRQAAERREQPPSLRARRRMGQRRRRRDGRRRGCPFGCARRRGRVPAARARRQNRASENARSRQLEPTTPHARSVSASTTVQSPAVRRL